MVGEGASEKPSHSDPSGKGQPREGQGEGHPGRKARLVTVPEARTWPVVATERLERLQPWGSRKAGDVAVQRRGRRRHVRGVWGSSNSEVPHRTPDPVRSEWENQDSSSNPKPQFPCHVTPPSNGSDWTGQRGWPLRGDAARGEGAAADHPFLVLKKSVVFAGMTCAHNRRLSQLCRKLQKIALSNTPRTCPSSISGGW